VLLRRVHDRRRLVQDVGDLREVAVARRDAAIDDASRELLGLAAELLLRYAQRRQVFLQLRRLLRRLVAQRVERSGDDLTLLLGELTGVVVPATAAPASALILLVVLREGATCRKKMSVVVVFCRSPSLSRRNTRQRHQAGAEVFE
jgi:hypothetical protein